MNGTKSKLESSASPLTVARNLHPEDISIGDHVAISRISYQYPTFLWCGVDLTMLPADQPVRISFLAIDDHVPMLVKSLCLPFLLCENQDGSSQVYDLRQIQLVRVDATFAKLVKAELDRSAKKKSKRKKKGKKKGKKK